MTPFLARRISKTREVEDPARDWRAPRLKTGRSAGREANEGETWVGAQALLAPGPARVDLPIVDLDLDDACGERDVGCEQRALLVRQ